MTAVLSEVARRGLSDLYDVERAMDKPRVLAVLRGEAAGADAAGPVGDLADRARLACLFAVSDRASGSDAEVAELCAALIAGADRLPVPREGAAGAGDGAAASFGAIGATLGSLIGAAAAGDGGAGGADPGAGGSAAAEARAEAERLCSAVRWIEQHRRETSVSTSKDR